MHKKILLPLDLHEESSWKKALPTAVELCTAFGAELHVFTVFPDLPVGMYRLHLPEDTEHRLAEAAVDGLDAFAAEHIPDGVHVVKHVRTGGIYRSILGAAEEIAADRIMMASHRPEMGDYLIDPNAARVVRHSNISVLVVR